MEKRIISSEDTQKKSVEELFHLLETSGKGLSLEEVKKRESIFGKNAIEEKKRSWILQLLSYFWGPIPWMIEIAAVLSFIVKDLADVIIILILLIFNALIGFFEEHQAGNAVEALKKKLASKTKVLRDGSWKVEEASSLVPGDVIRIRLGDIVPADVKLMEGDYLSIDQAALTGESLPVSKKKGEIAYSGSIAKQGEMVALVTATSENTYFGKTTKLVETAGSGSHFQKAVMLIGRYLIYLSLFLVAILVAVQLDRGDSFLELAQFALILTVASIPVAMPAVLSVTMAAGALAMAKMKAIVTKLASIEEMAGMTTLCSDKTGTLTQNLLALQEAIPFGKTEKNDVILMGALASKEENQDPIDLAVLKGIENPSILKNYTQTNFIPFDPVAKRTEATIEEKGNKFFVTKGAPQIVLELSQPDQTILENAKKKVEELAQKGYRTLGVAKSKDKKTWEFLGLLPLSDPLRPDSKKTIREAFQHGIDVKMVTGDNLAIAKEIAGQLGLTKPIFLADHLFQDNKVQIDEKGLTKIKEAGGFAQVFPEHKYGIVKALQAKDEIVGMTGDGVNDSPALKQADVGIAVSGATDAARAAASLVLTAPGLSVIINAVEEARRIFERMQSYAIYRICETIRIMFFIVLTMLAYNVYPITAIMIILLALLNDLPIMTIAYDHTYLDPSAVRWQMKKVLGIATSLGLLGVVETLGLFIFCKSFLGISQEKLQSIVFLKLVVAGHLTLFVARAKKNFFLPPYPAPILLTAVMITQIFAALVVGFGWFVPKIPWAWIGWIWLYCLVWIFIEDALKIFLYKHMKEEGSLEGT